MIQKLGTAVVGALTKALTVVVLFVLLIGVVKWARANPAEWQALVDKGITTAATALGWVFDQIGAVFS
jgi:hypothetical protein